MNHNKKISNLTHSSATMRLSKSSLSIAVGTALGMMAMSPIAQADDATIDDIEKITVHGAFREQSLHQTKSSLSVISEQLVDLRAAQNLEDIAFSTPNLNFSSGSSRARFYQIRGIGETSQFAEPINPSVGLLIDDIDFSGIGSANSMFDVEQVEVFRGPQGSRFGANAMAGLINVKTKDPSESLEGKVKLMAGNYGTYALGAAVSGPATDKLHYRFAAEQYKSDGYIDNVYLGRDDTNDRDELTLRAKFRYFINDDLTLDTTIFRLDMDNGYDAFSLDNTRETLSDEPGFDKQTSDAIGNRLTFTGFDAVDVETLLSYADTESAYGYDEDWSFVGIHPWEYSSTDHYFRDRSSLTAEMRFLSKAPARLFNESTDWVSGAYYRDDEEDLSRIYTYASDFDSNFDTENMAIFGELTSTLAPQWMLTTGVRVEYRDASYQDTNLQRTSTDETMVGGKLVLGYELNGNTNYFASINRGYKAGGFNIDPTLGDNFREFDTEYLWNFELGFNHKLHAVDGFLRATAFYMDRDEMQVDSSFEVLRDDGSTEFIQYIGNAGSGENYGLELETGWQATPSLYLSGTLGLLESEYKEYVDGNGCDLSGRTQSHAPEYQFSAGANYQLNDNWQVSVSMEGKDAFYVSNACQDVAQKTNSYVLYHASISYFTGHWEVQLWSRNLFDKDYYVRGFDTFGNDPRKEYAWEPYFQYGEPMVWGATLNYSF